MAKQIKSGYELACGGVQRENLNNHWVELYKESGCYHVRTGENGEKWSEWKTFDSGDKSPLKLARECYAEFKRDIKNLAEYLYVIDLDERGEFRAHLENKNCPDSVNFSLSNDDDGVLWIVQDGFMKHTEDLDGLEKYLKQMNVIPAHATIEKGN